MESMFSELVRFSSKEDFPYQEQPEVTDYYLLFEDILSHKKLSSRVIGISGVYPIKRPKKVSIMLFITVNTNRTYYAALKEVESVFGLFYLESGILPSIKALPKEFIQHPKDISPYDYRNLITRGILLYGT